MSRNREKERRLGRTLGELTRLWRADRSELGLLVAYFVLTGILSFVLFDMLVEAWGQQDLLWEVGWAIIHAVPIPGVDPILAFLTSVTVALVCVMILDSYKRVQGSLLLVGLVIGGAILQGEGLLIENVRWLSPAPLLAVLAGFAWVVLVTGAWTVVSGDTGPPYEFRRVTQAILVVASVAVVLGYLEAHGLGLPGDLGSLPHLASFLLPAVLYQFTSYENRVNPLVIGPARSGKTWMMGGLNYSLAEGDVLTPYSVSTGANYYLSQITENIRQEAFDEIDPNQPNELHTLEFQYLYGAVFPKRVRVRSLDYAGELLERVSDHLVEDVSHRSGLYDLPFVTPMVHHRYLSKLPGVESPWNLHTDSLDEVLELTGSRTDGPAGGGARGGAVTDGGTSGTTDEQDSGPTDRRSVDRHPGERADRESAGGSAGRQSGRAGGPAGDGTGGPGSGQAGGPGSAGGRPGGATAGRATHVSEVELLAEAIHHADTLVFVLPMDNFTEFIDMASLPEYSREMQMAERIERARYLAVYGSIAGRYENKDAFTVATMADLVENDYESRYGLRATSDYDSFANYTKQHVIGDSAQGFTNQLDDASIYPVYWEVDDNDPMTEGGNIKPVLDLPDSRPPLRGTTRILDRLGR